MAELPVEHFTVYDTPLAFQGWLTAYGRFNIGVSEFAGRQQWQYQAIENAIVQLEFDTDPDRLEVTATLMTLYAQDGWVFDGDPAALEGFKALCGAIRKRYAPEQGARSGTLARVAECHRLVRDENYSLRDALKKAGTHYDTYQRYCKGATGEEPYTRA